MIIKVFKKLSRELNPGCRDESTKPKNPQLFGRHEIEVYEFIKSLKTLKTVTHVYHV